MDWRKTLFNRPATFGLPCGPCSPRYCPHPVGMLKSAVVHDLDVAGHPTATTLFQKPRLETTAYRGRVAALSVSLNQNDDGCHYPGCLADLRTRTSNVRDGQISPAASSLGYISISAFARGLGTEVDQRSLPRSATSTLWQGYQMLGLKWPFSVLRALRGAFAQIGPRSGMQTGHSSAGKLALKIGFIEKYTKCRR